MKPEISLPLSQQPGKYPYPEPEEHSPRPLILFLSNQL
jgi:hypothetical protein